MQSRLETSTQLLQELYGQPWGGQATFATIRALLNNLTTAATAIASCVKSLATDRITMAKPQASPSNHTSPSISCQHSSRSISLHFPHTDVGKLMLTIDSEDLGTLYRLLAESDGSLAGDLILPHYVKRLRMILNVASPTS
jgi:hypothetical protein